MRFKTRQEADEWYEAQGGYPPKESPEDLLVKAQEKLANAEPGEVIPVKDKRQMDLLFDAAQKVGLPDDNPKTRFGVAKLPLHLVPPSAIAGLAEALANGAEKYGPYNWREKTISASVYYGACKRHLDAWWDGEELAPDSLIHHLKHAAACIALLLDAMSIHKLNDDRPPKGAMPELIEKYNVKQE